ncbi:MAG: BrnT family toxin [Betaproteobacteria bacterium]|nr:BrnT family toxin [Betaproteobacteria bacterium]
MEFDEQKRIQTLLNRDLDFARAGEVFSRTIHTFKDQRESYGEKRFITLGFLDGRLIVVVWTIRGVKRRVISMRKANEREIKEYAQGMG